MIILLFHSLQLMRIELWEQAICRLLKNHLIIVVLLEKSDCHQVCMLLKNTEEKESLSLCLIK